MLPALAVLIAGATILAAKQRAFPAVLAGGTLIVSSLALIGGHITLGVMYPWSRTGLHIIWLFLAACFVIWTWAAGQQAHLCR